LRGHPRPDALRRAPSPAGARQPGSATRSVGTCVPTRSVGTRRDTRALARQFLVADAVRLIGLDAQALLALRLVHLVVALAPHRLAVALEGEDVRGDAVEEPAVVAD